MPRRRPLVANSIREHTMSVATSIYSFEAELKAQGFDNVDERHWQPLFVVESHVHPFDAQGLVVRGDMWLTVGAHTQHISSGGVFAIAAGTPHSERYGSKGTTCWVGRRTTPTGLTPRMKEALAHTGRCLCGGVRYSVPGPLPNLTADHGSQYRSTLGGYVAVTSVASRVLTLNAADSLAWYRSSDTEQRGFCKDCGSNLFWREVGSDSISITVGTLDAPTGIHIDQHIFVAGKPG